VTVTGYVCVRGIHVFANSVAVVWYCCLWVCGTRIQGTFNWSIALLRILTGLQEGTRTHGGTWPSGGDWSSALRNWY
jgi:hypothetical protein